MGARRNSTKILGEVSIDGRLHRVSELKLAAGAFAYVVGLTNQELADLEDREVIYRLYAPDGSLVLTGALALRSDENPAPEPGSRVALTLTLTPGDGPEHMTRGALALAERSSR